MSRYCYYVLLYVICVILGSSSRADEEKCTPCPGEEQITHPEKKLNTLWPVPIHNCSMLETYANSLERNSEECMNVQKIGTICGCPVSDNACRLCGNNNDTTTRPEKELPFLAAEFDGKQVTCEIFESYLHSLDSNSTKCVEAQWTGLTCGCPVLAQNNVCDFCSGHTVATPDRELPRAWLQLSEWNFDPLTCELLESVVHNVVPSDTPECNDAKDASASCGCPASPEYHKREVVLVWLPRISATLSFFGSLYIIAHVWKQERIEQTTQHHLLLCMSCIDCASSIAWALTTLPIPVTDEDGNPTNVYGARGNEATCTAQGFFIQLGLASPFYNLALAVYYMLVVAYGWREDQVKRINCWLYVIPLLVGLGLAFAGIPFYEMDVVMCYISSSDHLLTLIFLAIPLLVVIVLATVFTIKVYLKVYYQERTARRWRMARRSNVQSLPRKVFWQGFWYLMCFYASWPLVLIAIFTDPNYTNGYGFLCVAMFFTPLQGWWNFIAYSRPHLLRCLKQNSRCCCLWKSRFARWSTTARTVLSHEQESIVSATHEEAEDEQATGPSRTARTGDIM